MKIYLSCPYSHPDALIRQDRFQQVSKAAGILMQQGHYVFSPISHSHAIAVMCNLPLGWDYWEPFDRSLIEWSDELHVLMLDGWDESKGVSAEMEIARQLSKPIRWIDVSSHVPVSLD